MTKEKAISLIRHYRRDTKFPKIANMLIPRNGWFEHTRSVYEGILYSELIEKIKISVLDPIDVAREMYFFYDDILSESDDDAFLVHDFARICENSMRDILDYLKRKDKE